MNKEKSIYWIGSSYNDLLEFPVDAKQEAGYQLHRIQNGLEPENWKPFSSVGAGVKEIRISDDGKAYRVMYVAKFKDKIYVLHAFNKKSQKTSSNDVKITKTRFNAVIKMEQ